MMLQLPGLTGETRVTPCEEMAARAPAAAVPGEAQEVPWPQQCPQPPGRRAGLSPLCKSAALTGYWHGSRKNCQRFT